MDDQGYLGAQRERFAGDHFATEACGCQVVEAAPGRAVCAFDVGEAHRNARGAVMGGAILTLADFALAVASNHAGEEGGAVTLTTSAEFLAPVRGSRVVATCEADREGRRVGFYTTQVTDELGTQVAKVTSTTCRVG